MKRRTRLPALRWIAALLVLAASLLGIVVSLRTAPAARIEIEPELPGIGRRAPISVRLAAEGRGLSRVSVEVVQGELARELGGAAFTPPPAWALWQEGTTTAEIDVEAGSEAVAGLSEGSARLRVVAERAGTWLLQPEPVVAERELPVRLRPPTLDVLSAQHYVTQGGSGVVVYRVGEHATRDGVEAGDWFFPGIPLPERGEGARFALFGAPYDLEDAAALRLVAEDALGNRATTSFVDRYFERPLQRDRIGIDDDFMARVMPAILQHTPSIQDRGGLLENYLAVNGELRRANATRLIELGRTSAARFLWHEAFLQLPGGKVMSRFADRRTYVYEGREVDQQDHLGFDLASTRRAEVPASNTGVVALAEYFGIYGNTVVLDHGHGLMSLYAHLSDIDVAVGHSVQRGQSIGRTGATGLAGGDHLHFTLLIRGLAVNPVEWWDPAWIRDRLVPKLGEGYFRPDTT